jgi:hypothetical protein
MGEIDTTAVLERIKDLLEEMGVSEEQILKADLHIELQENAAPSKASSLANIGTVAINLHTSIEELGVLPLTFAISSDRQLHLLPEMISGESFMDKMGREKISPSVLESLAEVLKTL